MPPELAERLELWSARLPDESNVNPYYHGFEPYSYNVMLLGLGGHLPTRHRPALDLLGDDEPALKEFDLVGRQARELAAQLPGQYEYLAAMR